MGWMGVAYPYPPVRDDIVTPRYLFLEEFEFEIFAQLREPVLNVMLHLNYFLTKI